MRSTSTNEREPERRLLYLNYSAVEPSLTNERCSPWHFRFDAHADMRLSALMDVLAQDASVKRAYLIGQDYSFGQYVVKAARVRTGAAPCGHRGGGRGTPPDGPHQGLPALRSQDQGQWCPGGDHRQLGQ